MKINRIDIKGEVYDIEAYENPVPTGSVIPFAGETPPEGFLLCNGQEVSRITYARLFSVIGEKWGAGDGVTTFEVPNLVGRFIEGTESSVGQMVPAGLPNITGRWNHSSGYESFTTDNGAIKVSAGGSPATGSGGGWRNESILFDASRSSNIFGKSNTVQPASAKMLLIIKD